MFFECLFLVLELLLRVAEVLLLASREFAAFAAAPTPLAGPGLVALIPLATVGPTEGLFCGTLLEATLFEAVTGFAGC